MKAACGSIADDDVKCLKTIRSRLYHSAHVIRPGYIGADSNRFSSESLNLLNDCYCIVATDQIVYCDVRSQLREPQSTSATDTTACSSDQRCSTAEINQCCDSVSGFGRVGRVR